MLSLVHLELLKVQRGENMKITAQIITLLFATSVFAQVEAGSLKSAMKEMASALKTITVQANDASKNTSSSELAGKFVLVAQQAKGIYPSSANDDASKAKFAEMMDAVIVNGQLLQTAFASNDNTKATAILNQLVQDKKDGHSKFRQ